MASINVSKSNIIIATHYLVYGAPQALRDYLIGNEVQSLMFIGYPLKPEMGDASYCELIKKGKVVKKEYSKLKSTSFLISFIMQPFLTLFWFIKYKEKIDLYIGVDCFNAIMGVIFRKLGLVKKSVFYTIDYVPERFESHFLNELYHWIDRFCVTNADETWNVSYRIAEGREKIRGLKKSDHKRQKVVPIGIWFDKVERLPFSKIKKNQFVFLGHISEHQGVQYVIRAIPKILREVPNFHFLIIGGGDYEPVLKDLVEELKISKHITFTGWVKSRAKIDRLMSDSAVAIAMYDKEKAKFTYYADPTKLKDYMSAGLPILLTDVPHNAYEIQDAGAGKVIEYDVDDIAENVTALMKDEKTLMEYRNNAVKYVEEFDWNNIFNKAL